MAESETNVAEGSAACTESFNSVGDVLNEDGLAAAVEDFVQPQEPDSEPEPPAQVESEEHGEPENDLSQVEEESEEQSSNVQKRIDKLTRQRKEAEADADTHR